MLTILNRNTTTPISTDVTRRLNLLDQIDAKSGRSARAVNTAEPVATSKPVTAKNSFDTRGVDPTALSYAQKLRPSTSQAKAKGLASQVATTVTPSEIAFNLDGGGRFDLPTPPGQEILKPAIAFLRESSFAKTDKGKAILAEVDLLSSKGRISVERIDDAWGITVRSSKRYPKGNILVSHLLKDPKAVASLLVHEATHALFYKRYPANTQNSYDQEADAIRNELSLYGEYRNSVSLSKLDEGSKLYVERAEGLFRAYSGGGLKGIKNHLWNGGHYRGIRDYDITPQPDVFP